MASNTYHNGQGITSGVNLSVFRTKIKPKREIGAKATHPPPQHILQTNKVDINVNNDIEIESESEQQDIDLAHINTITSTDDNNETININESDIILTDQKEENELDNVIFNNVNTICTTQHEVGTSGGTVDGLNYNYNRSNNFDIPEEDINSFINISSRIVVKGYQSDSDDGDNFDDTESVLSEIPDENAFNNFSSYNFKTKTIEDVYYDNNIKYDVSKIGYFS